MGSLAGKNLVLGVTGGIAAYKAVEIASRLKKAGASVHVIETRGAQNFVTPLTFREISGHPVAVSMWDEVQEFHVEHIALAQLADAVLVAPATANLLAKAALGLADDMLTTTILATKAPVFYAPAMNTAMYENPATQENLQKLSARGAHIIPPESGSLACGSSGVGRLPEPEHIVEVLSRFFQKDAAQDFLGKRVLVTAGGTIEPLDPVRYLGNRSSGKMGFALAEAAARRGAQVQLVAAPSVLPTPQGVCRQDIETALEMREAVLEHFEEADVVIKAAAVADYRPKIFQEQKIKKGEGSLVLELVRNPDILAELGRRKTHQVLVGFAAETQDLIQNAQKKLQEKRADFIVANDVSRRDSGFATDENRASILRQDGTVLPLPHMTKWKLANVILDEVRKEF